MKLKLPPALAAASMIAALALSAGAAQAGGVSVRFYDLGAGAPNPPGLTPLDTFSTDTVGGSPSSAAGYLWSGPSDIANGSSGSGNEPFSGVGFAGGNYLDITKNETETLTLTSTNDRYVTVYAGSVDAYNTLTITMLDGGGTFTESLGQLKTLVGGQSNQSGMFTFLMPDPIKSISFTTTQDSFEIGSVFAAPTPEPATWALLIMGVGLVGGALRLSRKSSDIALATA